MKKQVSFFSFPLRDRVTHSVLPTSCRVIIQDSIDPSLGANVDDTIKIFESLGFQNSGIHVILEKPIVECDTNAI